MEDFIYLMSSIAMYLVYTKLFYFLRLLPEFSSMVRLILNVFYSIRVFIFIFLLWVFATANCIYILQQSGIENPGPDFDSDNLFAQTPFMAFLWTWELAIGDVQYDFSTSNNEVFCYILYLLSVFILNIMLLNLIINIMGGAYEESMETAGEAQRQEQVAMIIENPQVGSIGENCDIKELLDPFLIHIKEIDDVDNKDGKSELEN
jgi:hypothetical protein